MIFILVAGQAKRSSVYVNFETLGFRVKAPGDLTNEELDEALDALSERSQSQEKQCLGQLTIISTTLRKFSVSTIRECLDFDETIVEKSEEMKMTIRSYFQLQDPFSDVHTDFEVISLQVFRYMRSDITLSVVRSVIRQHQFFVTTHS